VSTVNKHLIVTASEIDSLTGLKSSNRVCASVLTISRPNEVDMGPIAGVPDKGSLALWSGNELIGRLNDSEVPGLRRSLKRGLALDQWTISIEDPGEFKKFCIEAFGVLVGDFPDTDLSHWRDPQERQRSLSEEALERMLKEGHLSEAYFLVDGPVGDMIAANREGSVQGPWGKVELKKRPVVVTGPGLL